MERAVIERLVTERAKRRIEKLKQVHCLLSVMLFVLTFSFCSYTASDLKLINISLSHYGIYNKIGVIWNVSLFIVGIMLFTEAFINIKKFALHKGLRYLFGISIICLLLTATINMTHRIHFYTAYIYFIGFTLGMFLFGFSLIKVDFRIGITSIIISVISVLVPVTITMCLHSFAIPELTHTALIFNWLFITRYDTRYKNFLKRIGL
ncbi:MAG TPA: hypothetical protein VN026_15570 [Bacteroidia bacterium]|jgi:hypothetical membrane protein|nr:hypothetical protein [Bacteroidia bacterium]